MQFCKDEGRSKHPGLRSGYLHHEKWHRIVLFVVMFRKWSQDTQNPLKDCEKRLTFTE